MNYKSAVKLSTAIPLIFFKKLYYQSMYRSKMLSEEIKKIIELAKAGLSLKEISIKMNRGITTVVDCLRKEGLAPPPKSKFLPVAVQRDGERTSNLVKFIDPKTGKEIIPPTKFNTGKPSYKHYLKILADKEGKNLASYTKFQGGYIL